MRRVWASLLAAVVLVMAWSARGSAAGVEAVMPGFTAEFLVDLNNACGGQGATGAAGIGEGVYAASDGGLAYTDSRKGNTSYGGSPWGVAVLNGRLYSTEPACGVTVTSDITGTNCRLVERALNQPRATLIANICGYAVAGNPVTGRLTVSQRDGHVVDVNPSTGAATPLFDGTFRSLSWSSDGRRLYGVAMADGALSVWDGSTRRTLSGSGLTVLAGTASINLDGDVLLGGQGGVKAQRGQVATSSAPAVAMAVASPGIYVMFGTEVYLLRGRYTPPPPPTSTVVTAPPTTVRPRVPTPVTQPGAVQAVAPPQAPPPPPPPAPPAPPLATAAQVAAQPSAVANPAFVPGDQEREAALRLAATRAPRPVAPTMLWLGLIVVVCASGFAVGRAAGARAPAEESCRV